MVQVAFRRWAEAVGSAAGEVAGTDVVGESCWRPVGFAAVVEQVSGDGVGDQPSPGAAEAEGEVSGGGGSDRSVPGQLSGFVVQAQEGFQVDDDLNLSAYR